MDIISAADWTGLGNQDSSFLANPWREPARRSAVHDHDVAAIGSFHKQRKLWSNSLIIATVLQGVETVLRAAVI